MLKGLLEVKKKRQKKNIIRQKEIMNKNVKYDSIYITCIGENKKNFLECV